MPDSEEGRRLYYLQNLKNIQEEKLGITAISMDGTKKEIHRMLEMAKENVAASFNAFLNKDTGLLAQVEEREEYIDFLNKEISQYISKVITHERMEGGNRIFNAYFKITSNIERIGDHVLNIAKELAEIQIVEEK